MFRRKFLRLSAAAGAALTLTRYGCIPYKRETSPNIIFIMADDLGYGDLSCYGQTKFSTPNSDRLAKEGIKFTDFYAGSTVCAPSRCSLLTGLHTGHCEIRGNKEIKPEGQHPLSASAVTVAGLLKKAGYVTGATGKWGLGAPGSSGAPNKQGFDYFFGYNCQRQAHTFYPTHLWENEQKILLDENKDEARASYSHDLISDKALQFIEGNKDNPFFLYVPFTIPHAELAAPEESMKEYRGKFNEQPFPGGHYRAQEEPCAAFAAMVTRMDRDVGRILDLLKKLNIDENTLIMFTSDNGPHHEGGHDPDFFNSSGPLKGIKRDLYEGGIRVPMLARWPEKIKPGTVSDHVAAFWDVMPTATDIAGAKSPQNTDGISFLPSLLAKENQQLQHEFLYWEFEHRQKTAQAVRMGPWKGLRPYPMAPLELYNLEEDLGESTNVAEGYPELIKQIENYMESARSESELWPLKNGRTPKDSD